MNFTEFSFSMYVDDVITHVKFGDNRSMGVGVTAVVVTTSWVAPQCDCVMVMLTSIMTYLTTTS